MPRYPGLDRWRLLEKIGDGAFSSVYRASDTKSEFSEVAIKVSKKYEMHENQKKKLHEEAEITRKLDHDNVVQLIDSFESRQYHYMILELCPGGELYDQIIKLDSLSEKLSRHVITQVANGVEYLHQTMGVVHRDIKPENILFYPLSSTPCEESNPARSGNEDDTEEAVSVAGVRSANVGVVKLADFGLSKVICGGSAMTPCGTVGYAAPELCRKQKYTTGVDMWALGCLLFTMLTGFPPFYDEDIKTMTRKVMRGEYTFASPKWDHISDGAKDLVSRLLTVTPEERLTIKECLAHPWMRENSEEIKPIGNGLSINIETNNPKPHTTLLRNDPTAEHSKALTENENGYAYPGTPNVRDILNVALSVQQGEHQWQQPHGIQLNGAIIAFSSLNIKNNITPSITLTLLVRPIGAITFGILADMFGRKWIISINLWILAVLQVGTAYAAVLAIAVMCISESSIFAKETIYADGLIAEEDMSTGISPKKRILLLLRDALIAAC
ncbi:calcium/calmodulin-dependent protein kinase [Penicillium lagena]|uniref:calcium/calmodulin-dependent protein kinase n=1 Tax=Penicillium lagena TaxID=94218 RepID=UPI00253F8A98|nr:calcium/calmodulin-dependent protein kinase [Penicillium lagena]KAJ5612059.1 calcium/calmodulin-dependent protein kinase [Penicillium lagena]